MQIQTSSACVCTILVSVRPRDFLLHEWCTEGCSCAFLSACFFFFFESWQFPTVTKSVADLSRERCRRVPTRGDLRTADAEDVEAKNFERLREGAGAEKEGRMKRTFAFCVWTRSTVELFYWIPDVSAVTLNSDVLWLAHIIIFPLLNLLQTTADLQAQTDC